jgi:hypothetical protein
MPGGIGLGVLAMFLLKVWRFAQESSTMTRPVRHVVPSWVLENREEFQLILFWFSIVTVTMLTLAWICGLL